MVADSKSRRKHHTRHHASDKTIPSPAQVQAMAAEIRKTWSPCERERRALLARYSPLRDMIGW